MRVMFWRWRGALKQLWFSDSDEANRRKYECGSWRVIYAPAMLAMTVIYLVVEIAFNARLLDFALGSPSPDEVHSVERMGRYLSGVAAALWLWGSVLLPRLYICGRYLRVSIGEAVIILAMSGVLTVANVYMGEAFLFRKCVDATAPAQRISALAYETLSHGLPAGAPLPDDMARFGAGRSQDAERGLLAAYPVVAWMGGFPHASPDMPDRGVIRNALARGMGSPEQFYHGGYWQSRERVISAYDRYRQMVARYQDGLRTIPAQQDQAWSEYVVELQIRHYTPGSVPRFFWPVVARRVRQRDIPVAPNWRPDDRQAFDAAVATHVRELALKDFRTATRDGFGEALSPDLDEAAFVATAAVQDLWRQSLEAPAHLVLSADMPPAQFEDRVWRPLLDARVEAYSSLFHEPALRSGNTAFQHDARPATELLIAVAFALAFSTLGMIVHSWKVLYYGSLCCMRAVPFRRSLIGLMVFAGLAAAYVHEAPKVDGLEGVLASISRPVWVMNGVLYPLGNSIRQILPG
ncbi:hypothetical protein [Komagataeibacter sp. FNDCR2]|uniref:hypothetical protein n=1 Tax=Komagataeibacter sp. FNDCR2 TaxID=2878682 RepID=UPI001E65349B|nr:hypothetical protein [Komagataeibacter sp. FNDCR2]MCE2576755.1 hypothetical protein [Komagataeibacter sp. FNDCR2]